jgi:hypothetical protein
MRHAGLERTFRSTDCSNINGMESLLRNCSREVGYLMVPSLRGIVCIFLRSIFEIVHSCLHYAKKSTLSGSAWYKV